MKAHLKTTIAALALAGAAHASEGPWAEATGLFAAGYWPGALYAEGRLQLRTPLHRDPASPLFRDTFAGVGIFAGATTPLVRLGPHVTLVPTDIFELDLRGEWTAYRGDVGSGLLPFETIGDKLDDQRNARADEAPAGHVWSAVATPALRARVGPVIAVADVTLTALFTRDGGDSRYVYDPPRDLVVERDDFIVQPSAVLLYEASPGGMLLRAGLLYRDVRATGSGDRSVVLGPIATLRPSPAWPTFAAMVLPYLVDADRVGSAPQVLVAAKWDTVVWRSP